jgi:hypothetical protein
MSLSPKLNLFVLGGLLALTVVLTTGCGSKSSGNDAPAPVNPSVDTAAYDGDPGKFASLYTGTCVVQSATRTYTSCTTRIRIQQTASTLFVRTQFYVNQSNRSNSQKIVGASQDKFTITGKTLLQRQAQAGVIGRHGFYYTRAGQPYHFVRLYPNNYEYAGTFVDDSGRSVSVTGRVSRGSSVPSANRHAKVVKSAK